VCEQLAQSRYVKRSGRNSNLRPLGCRSTPQLEKRNLKMSLQETMAKGHLAAARIAAVRGGSNEIHR